MPAAAGLWRAWLRRHRRELIASGVLVIGFSWLLYAGGLPVIPRRESFLHVRWWAVPAYSAIWLGVLYLRCVRWYWLLAPIERVPVARVVSVGFISYAALVLLPFRLGELARPAMIRGGRLSAWAAAGTVGAERIIDGVFASVILFVALRLSTPLDPLPREIGNLPVPTALVWDAAHAAVILFSAALAGIGLFYWQRARARRIVERIVQVGSPRVASWLASALERLAQGFDFLPRWRYLAPFLIVSAVYWALNAVGILALCVGCGLDTSVAEACATMGLLGLGLLLPNAPGFFGAFQLSIYCGLALFHPPDVVADRGAPAVFLLYVLQMGIVLLSALVFALIDRRAGRQAVDTLADD